MTKNYDQTFEAGIEQPSRLKHNRAATVNPVGTDDTTKGYEPGSEWLNVSSGRAFKCVLASTGAAVWLEVGGRTVTISGHTFPTADFVSQIVYMPDHYNEFYFWTGSLWLSVNEHEERFMPQVVSANARTYWAVNWSEHAGVFITRAHYEGMVVGTNDGTNYWTQKVISIEIDGTEADVADSTVDTSTTDPDEFDYWTANPEVTVSDDFFAFAMVLTKTGSPGNIDPCMSHLAYRYVGFDPS